jgi:hypothetical protein
VLNRKGGPFRPPTKLRAFAAQASIAIEVKLFEECSMKNYSEHPRA